MNTELEQKKIPRCTPFVINYKFGIQEDNIYKMEALQVPDIHLHLQRDQLDDDTLLAVVLWEDDGQLWKEIYGVQPWIRQRQRQRLGYYTMLMQLESESDSKSLMRMEPAMFWEILEPVGPPYHKGWA